MDTNNKSVLLFSSRGNIIGPVGPGGKYINVCRYIFQKGLCVCSISALLKKLVLKVLSKKVTEASLRSSMTFVMQLLGPTCPGKKTMSAIFTNKKNFYSSPVIGKCLVPKVLTENE